MIHDIYFWLLLMLIAPFLGALLVPHVAEWFGAALVNHSKGLRALYPGLGLAAKAYKDAASTAGQVEVTDHTGDAKRYLLSH